MNAVVEQENNIVAVDQAAAVLNVLQEGLNKGLDADSLGKILAMQQSVMDRQAEQAYFQSLVLVQEEMPVIEKNRTNDQTVSKYADMEQILKVATPIYTKHGFCLSYGNAESPMEHHIRVTCDVMHSAGHSRTYHTDVPIDMHGIKGSVNKTKVHGTGSANTYGQRYLIKLIFNLNTGDDDDGNAAGGDTRSAKDIENEWIERMAILKEILPSILQIKENIALKEFVSAYEAWDELTDDEKKAVWHPAPTKGGILTTPERTIMSGNHWSDARKAIYGTAED